MRLAIPLVLGLVIGLGLGVLYGTKSAQAPTEPTTDTTELEKQSDELRLANETLEGTKRGLEEQVEALKEQLSERDTRIESLLAANEAAAPTPTDVPLNAEGLPIQFGSHGDLEELLNADWTELARAMGAMRGDLVELLEVLAEGGTPPTDLMIRIAKENTKLQQFALAANGKLPTYATGNGEFTHPIAVSNLMLEYLENEELPMTDSQRHSVARLGEDFEGEWARLEETYPSDTLHLQKLIDEARLKADFMNGLEGTLSAEQREALFDEETRGLAGFDLFSPGLMFTGYGSPLPVSSRDQLRPALMRNTATALGVDVATLEGHGAIFDRWVADIDGTLTPVSSGESMFYEFDTALTAGDAQLRAMQDLQRRLQLDPATLERLQTQGGFVVPRLIAPADGN